LKVIAQFVLSDLYGEKEPLIYADFVSLICADLRTEGSVNQRFLLLRKTN
jgi:hypothetical protein